MKKKLFGLAIALGLLCSVNAQIIDITGNYFGEVEIDASDFPEPLIQSENIVIVKTGDFYTLKINDFTLLDPDTQEPLILIGDIIFTGIEASLEGENVILSKAGISNGPVVYDVMPTTIELISCVITSDGEMSVNLLVDAYIPLDLDENPVWDINDIDPEKWVVFIDVVVDFIGVRTTSSIFSPKATTIAIFPTTTNDVVNVIGFDDANYAIYSLNGALVKSGVNNGAIDVSNLGSGIYFLNINDASAKFVKK